ncbi:hypothetical protein GPECTOR_65g161 [Gonium pectorale]|uniref:Uncharacterized protein n=1 Tax=Gonium pectorale TaxID=33097 RepID=A0A150G440_GONPE|nr:hypothetical protein GPECTOR_65g161 [Gonium pectorale]|eukprot:KXZ44543.1 hypothetical protein GPECTOR_65g161 [Gonium pectorale]
MDRAAKLQEIRDRQTRWLRERQAELDRQCVVAELQQQHGTSGGHGASPPPTQMRRAAAPTAGVVLPPLTAPTAGGPGSSLASSVAATSVAALGVGGVLPSTLGGVGGVKPEEVIDRLTERITDRLRNELKVELQRESESLAAQQGALDTFLVRELESQNTCPVCYEVMVPPHHAPMMLFPVRRQYERAATRMRVLRNELGDTAAEEEALGGRLAAAAAVVGHLQEEEAAALRRLAAAQAELELVREQLGGQGAKVADLARQADAVRQRRELLLATLGPLEAEVEKLELLMAGVRELRD